MGGKNESNLSRIPPKPDQRDLVSYFRRYRDIFFGPEPGRLHKFKPHKRVGLYKECDNLEITISIEQTTPNVRN